MRNRKLQTLLLCLVLIVGSSSFAQEAPRPVTDSAGRRVEIPQRISRVLGAGPPAPILPYTLAPEEMISWVRTPSTAEKTLLPRTARSWS